jgi:hypothetical protein
MTALMLLGALMMLIGLAGIGLAWLTREEAR